MATTTNEKNEHAYDLIGSIVPAIMTTVDGKQHPAEARIVATHDPRFVGVHPVTVNGRLVRVHNVYAEYAVDTVRRLIADRKPIEI